MYIQTHSYIQITSGSWFFLLCLNNLNYLFTYKNETYFWENKSFQTNREKNDFVYLKNNIKDKINIGLKKNNSFWAENCIWIIKKKILKLEFFFIAFSKETLVAPNSVIKIFITQNGTWLLKFVWQAWYNNGAFVCNQWS